MHFDNHTYLHTNFIKRKELYVIVCILCVCVTCVAFDFTYLAWNGVQFSIIIIDFHKNNLVAYFRASWVPT